MKWIKSGKIFDPKHFKLPQSCVEYAQSPQTLVFNDFIRIYFSTRPKPVSGKHISHIAYVDFDKDLRNILSISSKEVIKLGQIGCFDEHGIFPLHIHRDGNIINGYISGWNRKKTVALDGSIGLAVSNDDGSSFKRVADGPILTSSLNEPFLVGDPFVYKYNSIYHMWYIYGKNWIRGDGEREFERVYKIGHAISKDKLTWEKQNKQIISDRLNQDECQALPTVLYHNNVFHMYFCYREAIDFRKNRNKSYKLGYAFSSDLINWTRSDDQVGIYLSKNGWDSKMMCYPHIFKVDDKVYMLYNGNDFGKYGFGLAVLDDVK
jgi:predicted GH43/DUF377 family glycosyl hydrolase